jgi:hypothetical protein
VDDAAPVVSQYQEYVQHLESDHGYGEEVHRDSGLDVILEEGAPGLRWRFAMARQILADADSPMSMPRFEQLAVNAWCAPSRILAGFCGSVLGCPSRPRAAPGGFRKDDCVRGDRPVAPTRN